MNSSTSEKEGAFLGSCGGYAHVVVKYKKSSTKVETKFETPSQNILDMGTQKYYFTHNVKSKSNNSLEIWN